MSTVTIAVDLAKHVFEIAVAGRAGSIRERKRLSRPQFEHFWSNRAPCRVVMEACASAHFWARYLIGAGFDVVLLPPHYVKPYRRRNKTDRADCEAILEAHRCSGIHPVSIKSEDQQALVACTACAANGCKAERHESTRCAVSSLSSEFTARLVRRAS
jgi:transposase